MFEEQAKERQKDAGGDRKSENSKVVKSLSANSPEAIDSRKQAAKAVNVGERIVQDAQFVRDHDTEAFPDKTQQAISEQVGCSQQTVMRVQTELIQLDKLTIPATRTGLDGKERPTTYKRDKIENEEARYIDEQPKRLLIDYLRLG